MRLRLMGLTEAQRNAKRLLQNLQIDDSDLTLRKACADIELSAVPLGVARRKAANGNTEPLRTVAARLVARGVIDEMARRICGIQGLDSDVVKRRRDGAAEDEPARGKAARSTPATAHDSEDDAGSDGA